MNNEQALQLSLEQTVEIHGDPTPMIFEKLYRRFPELTRFKEEGNDWEHYMMQEILENLMLFAREPESALITIKDMVAHHELIGVSCDVFKGMYEMLLETMTDTFYGPKKEDMIRYWRQSVATIVDCIERNSLYPN